MNDDELIRFYPTPVDPSNGVKFCGFCAAGSLLLASTGIDVCVMSGLLLAGIFSGVAFLCTLSPRPGEIYLELTPEGFREHSPHNSRSFRWDDIRSFDTVSDCESGEGVAFRFDDSYRGARPRKVLWFPQPFDGRLHDNYGVPARDLADRLNAWRLSPGSKPPAPAELVDDLL